MLNQKTQYKSGTREDTLSHGPALTLKDLPPTDTVRWVTSRKAVVVSAVRQGLLSEAEACARYNLSEEEFSGWGRMIDRHGVKGLRTTRIQQYR